MSPIPCSSSPWVALPLRILKLQWPKGRRDRSAWRDVSRLRRVSRVGRGASGLLRNGRTTGRAGRRAVNVADLIGMSEEFGTIEPGKHADLIAVGGSPLENIDELLDVDFVMKGGKVFKD